MAPAAHATTRDLPDASGDVMTATFKDNGDIKYNREHGAEGDILFTRIQHTATQVVVYLRCQQLTVPRPYASFEYGFEGNKQFATVGIARGCLKSPKYVRLNHLSYRFRMNESTFKILYDNPARDGGTINQVSTANTPWAVTG